MNNGFSKLLSATFLLVGAQVSSGEGWHSLFDGETLAGWTRGRGQAVEEGKWQAEGGVLTRKEQGAGSLFSAKSYQDFEFSFEWKIAKGGNSGVKYRVSEVDSKWLGLEYQILDDQRHKAAQGGPKNLTAALYALKAVSGEGVLNPAEQWNRGRIKVEKGKVTHYLNGKEVVTIQIPSPEWQQRLDGSKYREVEGFGLSATGRLMLQDHGGVVSFRNLKVREL